MAGIYLHVPYCKVKCHYCDFHFSTRHQSVPAMQEAMKKEIAQRAAYLQGEPVSTIYFGGGTPSLFSIEMINDLLSEVARNFVVTGDAEITLECNPDDLDVQKTRLLRSSGINRLSIGVQSFDATVLHFMNRAHNDVQALKSLDVAREAGFENLTIDLIYGIPGKDLSYWKKQLQQFEQLEIPHLSSYCLTIEPKTYFGKLHREGRLAIQPDEESIHEFRYLMDFMRDCGYEHYEISNFARPGFISRHNSAYWLGEKYLGIGPSAHSYDQRNRGWNIANNARYIALVNTGEGYFEEETLTPANRFNDYILTRLRTKWGVKMNDLSFVSEAETERLAIQLEEYRHLGLVERHEDLYRLTNEGKFRADGIAADLFI